MVAYSFSPVLCTASSNEVTNARSSSSPAVGSGTPLLLLNGQFSGRFSAYIICIYEKVMSH